MEQNFKEPSAGHCDHLLRSDADCAGKNTCVIVVREKVDANADFSHVLSVAKTYQAPVFALYCCPIDLCRYGEVDHLAPAPSVYMFLEYVMKQEMEIAEQIFALLLSMAPASNVNVTVLALRDQGSVRKKIDELQHKYGRSILFEQSLSKGQEWIGQVS